MSRTRRKTRYWRRQTPPKGHDITRLRPPSSPKGVRFETPADAAEESIRSERLLEKSEAPRSLLEYLSECRNGDYVCERTFCPRCARTFRRWFIGEVLGVVDGTTTAHVITVLLAQSADVGKLDPRPFRHMLRKRLDRAGLDDAAVIGGFEIVWRARDKNWVLHVNLLVLGGSERAFSRFEQTFRSSALPRPTQTVPLSDLPEQVSYLLKFTTYHRPHRQTQPQPPCSCFPDVHKTVGSARRKALSVRGKREGIDPVG